MKKLFLGLALSGLVAGCESQRPYFTQGGQYGYTYDLIEPLPYSHPTSTYDYRTVSIYSTPLFAATGPDYPNRDVIYVSSGGTLGPTNVISNGVYATNVVIGAPLVPGSAGATTIVEPSGTAITTDPGVVGGAAAVPVVPASTIISSDAAPIPVNESTNLQRGLLSATNTPVFVGTTVTNPSPSVLTNGAGSAVVLTNISNEPAGAANTNTFIGGTTGGTNSTFIDGNTNLSHTGSTVITAPPVTEPSGALITNIGPRTAPNGFATNGMIRSPLPATRAGVPIQDPAGSQTINGNLNLAAPGTPTTAVSSGESGTNVNVVSHPPFPVVSPGTNGGGIVYPPGFISNRVGRTPLQRPMPNNGAFPPGVAPAPGPSPAPAPGTGGNQQNPPIVPKQGAPAQSAPVGGPAPAPAAPAAPVAR